MFWEDAVREGSEVVFEEGGGYVREVTFSVVLFVYPVYWLPGI